MNYLGYRTIKLDDYQLANFYEKKNNLTDNLLENEYLLIESENGDIVDEFVYRNGELKKINYQPIQNNFSGTTRPLNAYQKCAFDLLQNQDITVKMLTGVQGSGKTFLLVISALQLLNKGLFDKIIWVRNNIEVRDSTPLGALPGSVLDKLLPFAMPLADHLGGIESLEHFINQGSIEIQHIGYMRGRDCKNSIIISSECENLTKEQVRMLVGRVGINSNLWLDGDSKQADKKVFESNSGLTACIEALFGNSLFGHVYLPKTERSKTAALADLFC